MATRSIYEDMIAVLFSVDVSVRQLKVDRNSSALGTAHQTIVATCRVHSQN